MDKYQRKIQEKIARERKEQERLERLCPILSMTEAQSKCVRTIKYVRFQLTDECLQSS